MHILPVPRGIIIKQFKELKIEEKCSEEYRNEVEFIPAHPTTCQPLMACASINTAASALKPEHDSPVGRTGGLALAADVEWPAPGCGKYIVTKLSSY